MHRLHVRLRSRPTTVSPGWAGLLSAVGLVHAARFAGPQPAWRAAATVLLAVLVPALLAVRLRAPGPATVGGVLLGVGQVALGVPAGPVAVGYLVLAYSAAAYGPVWALRLALAGGALAGPLAVLRFDPGGPTGGVLRTVLLSGFLASPFVLCWASGRLARVRRAYLSELEDRAARLERERDARAKVAVAAERARIARELHDVVAHKVSVMVVQADGAAHVLDDSPRQAGEALGALQVDYATSGHPRDLPRGVELTVYRRHARAGRHGQRQPRRGPPPRRRLPDPRRPPAQGPVLTGLPPWPGWFSPGSAGAGGPCVRSPRAPRGGRPPGASAPRRTPRARAAAAPPAVRGAPGRRSRCPAPRRAHPPR